MLRFFTSYHRAPKVSPSRPERVSKIQPGKYEKKCHRGGKFLIKCTPIVYEEYLK